MTAPWVGEPWDPPPPDVSRVTLVAADGSEQEITSARVIVAPSDVDVELDPESDLDVAWVLLGGLIDRQQQRCHQLRRVAGLCTEHRELARDRRNSGEINYAELGRYVRAERAAWRDHAMASAHGGGLESAAHVIRKLIESGAGA